MIANGFELEGNPLELTSRAHERIDQQEVCRDTTERVRENSRNYFLFRSITMLSLSSQIVTVLKNYSVKVSGIIQT